MKKFLFLLVLFISLARVAQAQVIDSVWSPPYICQAHIFEVKVFGMRADGSIQNGPENYRISNDTIYASFYFVPGIGPAIPTPFQRQLTIPAPPLGQYKIKVQSFYDGNPLPAHFTPLSVCMGVSGIRGRNDQEADLLFYPNPTAGTIVFLANELAGVTTVRVTDVNGKVFYTSTFRSGPPQTIDLGTVPPGLYLLQASSGKGQVTRRILKY